MRALSQLSADGRADRAGPSAARAGRAVRRGPGGAGGGRPAVPAVHRPERGGAGGLAAPAGRAEAGRPGPIPQPGQASGRATALPLERSPRRCRQRVALGRGERTAAGHAGPEPDQPQPGRQPREQLVLLADAFAGLPEAEADVLWLYHAESLSFEAIGQRLGLSRKSVRGILARGLKHLKRSLEGPPGGPLRYDDGPAH